MNKTEEISEQLRDIKPLLEIPDSSYYIYWGLIAFAILLGVIILFFIAKRVWENRKINLAKGYLEALKSIDWEDNANKQQFEAAFAYFREFLLSLIDNKKFDRGKYVDFHGFRSLYETLAKSPDSKLRRLSPEVAWHTLRTYIKGKSTGNSEYFDPESYAELPREEITVAPETYELVWDKVWNSWYRDLCVDEGYWDDQDLARRTGCDVQPHHRYAIGAGGRSCWTRFRSGLLLYQTAARHVLVQRPG